MLLEKFYKDAEGIHVRIILDEKKTIEIDGEEIPDPDYVYEVTWAPRNYETHENADEFKAMVKREATLLAKEQLAKLKAPTKKNQPVSLDGEGEKL